MFNFLRKNTCFICKKPLDENYAEVRYSDLDMKTGTVRICGSCADELEGSKNESI